MKKAVLILSLLFAICAAEAQSKRILVLGDSNGAATNGWVEQLKLLQPSAEFINLSIAGNTIGFDNGGRDTLNTLRNIDSYIRRGGKVDMVLVLLGTNDCKAEFGKDFDTIIANYEKIIKKLKSAYTGARIVVITPPPLVEKEEKYKGGAEKVEKLGKQMEELARKNGVEFVDIYSEMKPFYEKLTEDGVHLTSEGYRLMAEFINRELRPLLFVVGDSISIHYGPYLEEYIAPYFRYDRKRDDGTVRAEDNLDDPQGANGGDSRMVLDYVRKMKAAGRLAGEYLLLNCGMHDIKTDVRNGRIQISIDEYTCNLDSIYNEVAAAGVKLIWVNSTPVNEELHNTKGLPFNRYTRDAAAYNFVAERYFRSRGVPVVDLFSLSQTFPAQAFIDHVHYSDEYRKIQAAYIAGFLETV